MLQKEIRTKVTVPEVATKPFKTAVNPSEYTVTAKGEAINLILRF